MPLSSIERFVRQRETSHKNNCPIIKEEWIQLMCSFVRNFASAPHLEKQISWRNDTFRDLRSCTNSIRGLCIYTGTKPSINLRNILYFRLDGIKIFDAGKKRWNNLLYKSRAVECYIEITGNLVRQCETSLRCIILYNPVDKFDYSFRIIGVNLRNVISPNIILYPSHIFLNDFKVKCRHTP
jgi:hypothetical protein